MTMEPGNPTPRTACPQNPGPCPLCGAHLWPDWKDGFIQWRCDSFRGRDYTICQKPQCVERERDNLRRELADARERAARLEGAFTEAYSIIHCLWDQLDEPWPKMLDWLEQYKPDREALAAGGGE